MIISTNGQAYLKSLTVLYVEDEELTREMTRQFLLRISGVVVTAENGAKGLKAYRTHKPDIVITDIQMPVMDGLSMVTEIRTIDILVPIIVLTAYFSAEYLNKANSLGVDKYVIKPVDGAQLHEALLACSHRLLIEEKLKQAQAALQI
jgi:YesN/AraC family two-component response regulator